MHAGGEKTAEGVRKFFVQIIQFKARSSCVFSLAIFFEIVYNRYNK